MKFKFQIIISYSLIVLGQFHYFETSGKCSIHDWPQNQNIEISHSNVTISYTSQCRNNYGKNDCYTTAGLNYQTRFPVSSLECFSYSIKAKNLTFVGLFGNNDPPKSVPWVEILIGGSPNGLGNVFKKNGADIDSTYNKEGNSLNNYEYRGFWVSWVGGKYRIGYRGQLPFMTWQDPNPFPIISVGVDTCCGSIAKVVIEEPRCPGVNI